MQLVKYGPKKREVKVPAGWNFVKVGRTILHKDRYFNTKSHAFDPVEQGVDPHAFDKDLKVQPTDIIIRQYRAGNVSEIETDTHLIKISE